MTVLICLLSFIVFFTLERLAPARKLVSVKDWYKRIFLINGVQTFIIILSGYAWDKLFKMNSLLSISKIDIIAQSFLGYLIITFIFYWWHRARHNYDFFWLTCHQLHHSPKRLEVVTSFYKHPIEMMINSILMSATMYGFLGMNHNAVALTIIISAIAENFYHANIKTPFWLGYIFQRPEMHRVHHEMGSHHYNYSDLPLWDLIFGTFKNPKTDDVKCGFEDNKELQFKQILLCRDIFNRSSLTFEMKYILLILVGSLQMGGFLVGNDQIKGLGAVTVSAPLPIVFSQVNGLETFSQDFQLEYVTQDGKIHQHKITNKDFSNMKAPYNLRNVYGFAFAYGPAVKKEKLLFARNDIFDYAFCNKKSSMQKINKSTSNIAKWKVNVSSRVLNNQTTMNLEGVCKL